MSWEHGLCECHYKAPSAEVDASSGLWASDTSDLYFYNGYFFWGIHGTTTEIATKDYPIVSFYIDQDGQAQNASQLLSFCGQYQDGVPVWESSYYRLRYSIVHQGWILQDLQSADVPYIPIKSADTQEYTYKWYFLSTTSPVVGSAFRGYCAASGSSKTLEVTYALIATDFLKYQVDTTKRLVQYFQGESISFGYLVARVSSSGFSQDINLECYFTGTEDTSGNFVDVTNGQIVGSITFSSQREFTFTSSLNTSIPLSGSNFNTSGTNTASYQDQTHTYTVTMSFTGSKSAGLQRTPCYYGEIATWH